MLRVAKVAVVALMNLSLACGDRSAATSEAAKKPPTVPQKADTSPEARGKAGVESGDDVAAEKVITGDQGATRFSMFETPPDAVDAPEMRALQIDRRAAYLVHAPGTMVFALQPGSYEVSGELGIAPGAYLEGQTDGVLFLGRLVVGGKPDEEVLRRLLDPKSVDADRGFQRFSFKVETGSKGDLILETQPGPKGNTDWDWAFWTGIRVKPVVSQATRGG